MLRIDEFSPIETERYMLAMYMNTRHLNIPWTMHNALRL
jgi:hypothetical protein